MLKGQMVARTARMGKFVVTKREDGSEFHSISFTVATTRNYLQTKKVDGKVVLDEEGKPVKHRESDFILCEARGGVADLVNKYFNLKDENGKLISRRLFLEGHIQVDRITYEQGIQIEGIESPVYVEMEKTITKFIVDSIEFLDANPLNKDKATAKGVLKGKTKNTESVKGKAVTKDSSSKGSTVTEEETNRFDDFDPSKQLADASDFSLLDDVDVDIDLD